MPDSLWSSHRVARTQVRDFVLLEMGPEMFHGIESGA
jgi:hypothetical protein